jgi:hypothetical protein
MDVVDEGDETIFCAGLSFQAAVACTWCCSSGGSSSSSSELRSRGCVAKD